MCFRGAVLVSNSVVLLFIFYGLLFLADKYEIYWLKDARIYLLFTYSL